MIGDFWIPYSGPDGISLGNRADLAIANIGYIVPNLCEAISNVAKVAFFGLVCLLSLGQSSSMNRRFKVAAILAPGSIVMAIIRPLGILFPITLEGIKRELEDSARRRMF